MFGLGWTLIKGSSVPGPLRCPKTMALTKYVTFGKQGWATSPYSYGNQDGAA